MIQKCNRFIVVIMGRQKLQQWHKVLQEGKTNNKSNYVSILDGLLGLKRQKEELLLCNR